MQLDFNTLDVFTDKPFAGNPLAVVHDADALEATLMQAIAREFNISETVFVLKPANPMHSARVRIFTPGAEVPFAGHPTVGTAVLLATMKAHKSEREHDAMVVLEQNIGVVRVGVRLRHGSAAFAEFDAPRLPVVGADTPSGELIAAALDLIPREIGFENHQPLQAAAGNSFVFVPVRSLEAIGKARINPSHWSHAFSGRGLVGAFLYTRECVHTSSAFHARMFSAPEFGIGEDPATGSAAAAFAGVVANFDAPTAGWHKRTIEQGYEMGRPSLIALSLEIEAGKLSTVRIGGHAVQVSSGKIDI